MTEMLTAVARAIDPEWWGCYDHWLKHEPEFSRSEYVQGEMAHKLETARAAILALMEPTEDMQTYGSDNVDESAPYVSAGDVYRAMLRRALGEG